MVDFILPKAKRLQRQRFYTQIEIVGAALILLVAAGWQHLNLPQELSAEAKQQLNLGYQPPIPVAAHPIAQQLQLLATLGELMANTEGLPVHRRIQLQRVHFRPQSTELTWRLQAAREAQIISAWPIAGWQVKNADLTNSDVNEPFPWELHMELIPNGSGGAERVENIGQNGKG
ncbi:hypothetical protein CWE08_10915 [Aliidiomarina iranensis]|uniref:Uncharacterized protein n=1 Tax=Aliidiomarina iranensis TaxID=1434071 RepID=A0A432VR36_9GAMM|nr:hypothetical protein [Aliidiomarina iranensis]RUO18734.1 hypothetical protein CWE08_10915 [Aliidiomarina iranensis]